MRSCRRFQVYLTLVVLALFAVSLVPSEADAKRKKKTRKSVGARVQGKIGKQLDEVIQKLDADRGGFWGSALVARGNKVLLLKSYGNMSPGSQVPIPVDAQWDWASVSKQFTAAAILRLEMKRKLSIDDSIRKFFPDIPKDKQPVTLRHMLNHTSGLNNAPDRAGMNHQSREAYAHAFLKQPLVAKPGDKWAYNNEAYSVLAAVVEKVQKKSFEQYSIDELFKRARMTDTTFIGHAGVDLARVPKDDRGKNRRWAYYNDGDRIAWNYKGMGGVVSTTIDMFHWHRALQGNNVLSPKAKERMYKVGSDGYALGWRVTKARGDTFYSHSGGVGKHVTYFWRAKDSDVVVALVYGYSKPSEAPETTALRLYKLAMQK